MADLKLNVTEEKVTSQVVEDTFEIEEDFEGFLNNMPCYWSIKQVDEDTVECTNTESGEYYLGSIAEFNARMKY